MATKFMLELLAFVAIHPAEEFGVVRWAGAVCDAVGPVLSQSVLFGEPLQAGVGDGQLHYHVGFGRLLVVAPQCRQRLLHTALTWNKQNLIIVSF